MTTMQKPKPRGQETYPQSKEEAQKLRVSIIKAMGDPNRQNQVGKALQMDPQSGIPLIARSVAEVVANAIRTIKKKYNGKTDSKAVEMCIKLAIRQVELISKALGKGPIPEQMKMLLARGSAKVLDGLLGQKPGGQQQPGQPPPQPGQQPPAGQSPQQMAPGQAQPGAMPPPEEGLLGG